VVFVGLVNYQLNYNFKYHKYEILTLYTMVHDGINIMYMC